VTSAVATLHGSLWSVAARRLRARWLALRGAVVGAKASVGPDVVVSRARGLRLGARASLEEGVRILLQGAGASLTVGDFAYVGPGCRFDLSGPMEIGAHALFGPGCFVTDHNHGIAPDRRIDEQPCETRAVHVGPDAWLGAHVVVLPGVRIEEGAVVAAGAVVTQDVPAYAIVAGIPARAIGHRRAPPSSA
jgi:acetyltransferase-like isoleucine patch superfamily enzyme